MCTWPTFWFSHWTYRVSFSSCSAPLWSKLWAQNCAVFKGGVFPPFTSLSPLLPTRILFTVHPDTQAAVSWGSRTTLIGLVQAIQLRKLKPFNWIFYRPVWGSPGVDMYVWVCVCVCLPVCVYFFFFKRGTEFQRDRVLYSGDFWEGKPGS